MGNTSRRRFLKIAAISTGAGLLACAGAGGLATRTPKLDLIELEHEGIDLMSARILVAYATRCGSTIEVAQAITDQLQGAGLAVDLKPVKKVESLEHYDAVLLGSAIRMGSWLPEMKEFVEVQQFNLKRLPVAIFTVHMLNGGESEEEIAARTAYTAPIHALIEPLAEAFFAGRIELARMSFLDRMISKAMGATDQDLRDWETIGAWAGQMGTQLAKA